MDAYYCFGRVGNVFFPLRSVTSRFVSMKSVTAAIILSSPLADWFNEPVVAGRAVVSKFARLARHTPEICAPSDYVKGNSARGRRVICCVIFGRPCILNKPISPVLFSLDSLTAVRV